MTHHKLFAVALVALTLPPAGHSVRLSRPRLQSTDFNGVQHSLSEYRGKFVVLEWLSGLLLSLGLLSCCLLRLLVSYGFLYACRGNEARDNIHFATHTGAQGLPARPDCLADRRGPEDHVTYRSGFFAETFERE